MVGPVDPRLSVIQAPSVLMMSLLVQTSQCVGTVGTVGKEGVGPLSSLNGFGLWCSAALRQGIFALVTVIFSSLCGMQVYRFAGLKKRRLVFSWLRVVVLICFSLDASRSQGWGRPHHLH